MEKNIGTTHRAVRIIIGLVLVFTGVMGPAFDPVLVLIILIGLLLIATGATGVCPVLVKKKEKEAPASTPKT